MKFSRFEEVFRIKGISDFERQIRILRAYGFDRSGGLSNNGADRLFDLACCLEPLSPLNNQKDESKIRQLFSDLTSQTVESEMRLLLSDLGIECSSTNRALSSARISPHDHDLSTRYLVYQNLIYQYLSGQENHPGAQYKLAKIFERESDIDKSMFYYAKCVKSDNRYSEGAEFSFINERLEAFRKLSDNCKANNRYDQANNYLESIERLESMKKGLESPRATQLVSMSKSKNPQSTGRK